MRFRNGGGRIGLMALVCALVLALAVPSVSLGLENAISGKVTEGTDEVEGASVELHKYLSATDSYERISTVTTDKYGEYSFNVNDAGTYVIDVYPDPQSALEDYSSAKFSFDGTTPVTHNVALVSVFEPDQFEPDNVPAQAKTISKDGTRQDHSLPAGDIDWVKFEAVQGKTYVIETFGRPGIATDTVIELRDSVAAVADNDDKLYPSDLFSKITWTAPTTGTMYLGIADVNSMRGAYSVSVTESGGTTPPPPPPPPVGTTLVAVEGSNRYQTSVAASKRAFPGQAPAVVIATGENFADALGGASLAGAVGGPLLLTQKGSLPADVIKEVQSLSPAKAYVLGGTGAVGANVIADIKNKCGVSTVIRIEGSSRYETASKAAAETIKLLGGAYEGKAFVATGANFPDALGASPLSAAKGIPVVLANPKEAGVTLPAGVTSAIILGGDGAVSSKIEASLKSKLGSTKVSRIAGGDRFGTAAEVAKFGVSQLGLTFDGVGIATGMNFPDALGAGPALGEMGTVLLLAKPAGLPSSTRTVLQANRDSISKVHFFGGTGAIPTSVRNEVKGLLK